MNWAAMSFWLLAGALLGLVVALSCAERHRHAWERWEREVFTMRRRDGSTYPELWQVRRCETCGKTETARV